ncbi:MAG: hypothetical protein HZY76_06645 [Anaerolineae bacterium]|nr:MAG: hypothetical protein HZY76_06645 [Anaerolineae bacterium]
MPVLEIEGYFIDRQGHPLDQCLVEMVAWEGEVLASSVDWSDHFTLRIPNVTANTPVFFRIKARNPTAVSTHHEIDSPAWCWSRATRRSDCWWPRPARPTTRAAPWASPRPAWVILPIPEGRPVRRVN